MCRDIETLHNEVVDFEEGGVEIDLGILTRTHLSDNPRPDVVYFDARDVIEYDQLQEYVSDVNGTVANDGVREMIRCRDGRWKVVGEVSGNSGVTSDM